jgi:hypothetical protein
VARSMLNLLLETTLRARLAFAKTKTARHNTQAVLTEAKSLPAGETEEQSTRTPVYIITNRR